MIRTPTGGLTGLAGALTVAAGVSLTIENVTDGLLDAMTLNSAFVSRMLTAPRMTKMVIAAPAWTNGRSNAFPSFRWLLAYSEERSASKEVTSIPR